MSSILKDLRREIGSNREQLLRLSKARNAFELYRTLRFLAAKVSSKYGVGLEIHFLSKDSIFEDPSEMGNRNITILRASGVKAFEASKASKVHRKITELFPESPIEEVGFGYEGFKINLSDGKLIVLPGGVHLWCKVDDRIETLLDWLFASVY